MEKLGGWKGEQYFIIKLVCFSLLGLAHEASTRQNSRSANDETSALLLVRVIDL